jgi:hypothetical protein
MIAQLIFSMLFFGVVLYAWTEYQRTPVVAFLSFAAAIAGLYFVWFPGQSTRLAELVGIGRGADLILYTWACISLVVLLNLHLKLRTQLELITALARTIALANVAGGSMGPSEDEGPQREDSSLSKREAALMAVFDQLDLPKPPQSLAEEGRA